MKSLDEILPKTISTRDLAARATGDGDVTVNLTVNLPAANAAPVTGTVVPGRATKSAYERVSPREWGEAPPLVNSAPPEQLSRSTQNEFLPRETVITYPAIFSEEEVLGHVHHPALTRPPSPDYSVPEDDYKSYSAPNEQPREEQDDTPPGQEYGYPASYPTAAMPTINETHGARVAGALGSHDVVRGDVQHEHVHTRAEAPPRVSEDAASTPLADCLEKMRRGHLI